MRDRERRKGSPWGRFISGMPVFELGLLGGFVLLAIAGSL
jgi:hypothetical protein